ncbi:MAG: DUF116 domain-containing protein [Gemmatimonadetes bacterium]|nr:DUF116 domain-containing protein [Gemmatimonadota bacterium]
MATTLPTTVVREAPRAGVADPLRGCEPSGPQLLQLRSDRRLGHEWDDWDGEALPNGGVFDTPAVLFFSLAALFFAACLAAAGGIIWLAAPRLAQWRPELPELLGAAAVALAIGAYTWLALMAASFFLGRPLLPRLLAEGGLLARILPVTEGVGKRLGLGRDRAGNAALRVYNTLAAARTTGATGALKADELLVLLPRCLGKDGMQAALEVAARYGVPIFVAARGRYAREMIVRQRPKAVVAVACERDLVSGVHDVAGHLPVLGTTLGLPEGPCKNTTVDVGSLERQIRTLLALAGPP